MIERFPVWAPGEHGMERRRVYIYLPDEYYEKPKRQYPVLYMFDGHNVFYDEDATYGKSWGDGAVFAEKRQKADGGCAGIEPRA